MSVNDISIIDTSKGGGLPEMSDDHRDSLPLREPTYLILISLATGSKHGYAIMKDVEVLSDGRVLLSTSTLYTALKRLQESRWIQREEDQSSESNQRERKTYALTTLGLQVLQAEVNRMNSLAAAGQRAVGENA
jgi:DNA-binding PadR family transcriptional regulator